MVADAEVRKAALPDGVHHLVERVAPVAESASISTIRVVDRSGYSEVPSENLSIGSSPHVPTAKWAFSGTANGAPVWNVIQFLIAEMSRLGARKMGVSGSHNVRTAAPAAAESGGGGTAPLTVEIWPGLAIASRIPRKAAAESVGALAKPPARAWPSISLPP